MATQLVSPCACGNYDSCPSREIVRTKTTKDNFLRDIAAYRLTHSADEVEALRVVQNGRQYTIEQYIRRNSLVE